MKLYHSGNAAERPKDGPVLYVDGALDRNFRPEADIHLSHWVPNVTPDEYRADTSTEICFRFIDGGKGDAVAGALYEHLDVDGLLALFVLTRPKAALKSRELLVHASRIGDFWAWGPRPAQRLFQGLTAYYQRLRREGHGPQDILERCLIHTEALLKQVGEPMSFEGELEGVERAVRGLLSGRIGRRVLNERLVHFHLPAVAHEGRVEAALEIPGFNSAWRPSLPLPPAARNRFDRERFQLVSVEAPRGRYWDLFIPGYSWADTPDSWRPQGLAQGQESNEQFFDYGPLMHAAEILNNEEKGDGFWRLAERISPFKGLPGRGYPAVLSHLSVSNAPLPTSLEVERVVEVLAAKIVQ